MLKKALGAVVVILAISVTVVSTNLVRGSPLERTFGFLLSQPVVAAWKVIGFAAGAVKEYLPEEPSELHNENEQRQGAKPKASKSAWVSPRMEADPHTASATVRIRLEGDVRTIDVTSADQQGLAVK